MLAPDTPHEYSYDEINQHTALITAEPNADIKEAMRETSALALPSGIVIYRGFPTLSDQELVDFGNMFGCVVPTYGTKPEIASLPHHFIQTFRRGAGASTIPRGDLSSYYPHHDYAFTKKVPDFIIMHALTTADSGGNTHFFNTEGIYDQLREEIGEEFDAMTVVHSLVAADNFLRDKIVNYKSLSNVTLQAGKAEHPLTPINPLTGQRAVFWNPLTAECILFENGKHAVEVEDLIREHFKAEEDRPTYTHQWQPGDLLVADNIANLHQATPSVGDRLLKRISVALT